MSKLEAISGDDACKRHGPFHYRANRVGQTIVGKVCPQCLMEGLMKAQEKKNLASPSEAINARLERLKHAGVPLAFQNCDMDSYEDVNERSVKTTQTVRAYLKHFNRVLNTRPVPGMVFTGVPRTGKTHLACAMIDYLLANKYSALYSSAPQLLTAMEDARFGRHDLSATMLIAKHAKPSLLVIDEFGAHGTRDTDYQALFSIVDARYQANLPTLLITNLQYGKEDASKRPTGGPLESLIDDRLILRIRGNGGPLFAFDWPPYRLRGSTPLASA